MRQLWKIVRRTSALLLFLTVASPAARAAAAAEWSCDEVKEMNFDGLLTVDTETLAACVKDVRAYKEGDKKEGDKKEGDKKEGDKKEGGNKGGNQNAWKARGAENNRILSRLQKALRKQGDALEEKIAADQAAEKAQQKMSDEVDPSDPTDTDELKVIKKTVNFSVAQDLVISADKYDDYFFRLNTGYEFVAIDKFFDKGEPRVSLLMNRNFGGDLVTDDYDGFGIHYSGRSNFAALLESSAEESVTLPDDMTKTSAPVSPAAAATDSSTTAGSANNNITKTFSFELQYTWVFYRTRPFTPNRLREHWGLIVSGGGLKTDAEPKVASRFYYGLRTAINPEFYADFMFGHTSGLHSNRLEVRGQFPARTLANGDRIYLGGIGNFALDKRQRVLVRDADGNVTPTPLESDTVRVYISWNTDLKNLFGGGKGQS